MEGLYHAGLWLLGIGLVAWVLHGLSRDLFSWRAIATLNILLSAAMFALVASMFAGQTGIGLGPWAALTLILAALVTRSTRHALIPHGKMITALLGISMWYLYEHEKILGLELPQATNLLGIFCLGYLAVLVLSVDHLLHAGRLEKRHRAELEEWS